MLDSVRVQAGAYVPRDVAMEGPHTGVIEVVLEDGIGWGRGVLGLLQELHVTANRVLAVGDGAIPGAEALLKNPEVVAMQVHRMTRLREVVVHDETDRLCVLEVVDIPERMS